METAAATLAANERSSGQEAEVGAPNQSAGATNELSEEQQQQQQQQTNVLEATATTAEELNIMAKEMNEMTDVVEEQKLYIVEEEEQQQKSNNNEATVDIIAKPSDEAGVDATPNAKLLDDGEGSEQREQNMDEIPEQIKVLDDIISEFDAETTKPAALHNNSGENQSEDDGYMSLSRKNMSKKDSEDVPQTPSTDTVPEGSFNEVDASCGNGTAENLAKLESEAEGGVGEQQLIQTTLPKARAANTTPAAATNYSSLPCCGARNTAANTAAVNALNMCSAAGGGVGGVGIVGGGLITAKARTGSCNAERNALGIDISAVHNAVLRGNLAKLPEPMLNEHPVTIYPGPSTKSGAEGGARNKRHQLINSVEQHKEVCHMLNPHGTTSSSSTTTSGSSASNTTTTTSSSSSGEASPAASNLNVSAKATKKLPEQTATANAVEDVYSADSLEEEESTISTDITPVKQNGIAWEITFKNSNKKKQLKSKSGAKSHAAKKTQRQTDVCLDYNAMYNQSNMLGKGTFVIRRSAAKKPPRAVDIFGAPNVPSPPPPLPSTSTDVIYTSDSELSETSLPPPPPPAPQAAVVSPHSGEANFIYKECEASAAATRRGLEMAAQQRAALAPSPRERLSLNIESAHQSREACVKLLTHSGNSPEEQHNKFSKKCILNLSEKRLSAESMPDNTSSSEEFDEARLNGNGFELFPYNANGIKPPEYEHRTSATTTPHTDLAPTLEEDEELSDFSYGCAPLKQIENNISALLRGDMPLARIVPPTAPNIVPSSTSSNATAAAAAAAAAAATELAKRPLEFRPGVHKSESAKEMLLSQNAFGPLPPSPPSSNPDLFDYDAPLPPSPVELKAAAAAAAATNVTAVAAGGDYIKQTSAAPPIASYKQTNTTVVEVHATASGAAAIVVPPPPPPVVSKLDSSRRSRDNVSALRHFNDELPPPPAPAHKTSFEVLPPAVPPHRGHSVNSMKSWSIDSNYRKKSPKMLGHYSGAGGGSGITTPTGIGGPPMTPLPPPPLGATAQSAGSYESGSYTRRYVNYGTKRSLKQSPREEHRLQTSCSLPETPIFARGCDIPRTPYRRQNEPPAVSGSRTAPRSSTSNSINMGTSIVGIGAGNYGTSQMCRQRSINHALASNEMLRMTGAPARGWYPKQRSLRPVSTENIDRLASVRVWDNPAGMSGTGQSRKPLTLPPNLTPSFLHKSPREALRRVTSLLITKKKNTKERKHKAYSDHSMDVGDKHAYEFETGSSKRKESTRNTNGGGTNTNTKKKKGLFKTLWKRTKHVSLDQ